MTTQETHLHQLMDRLRTQLLIMGVKTRQALGEAVRAACQRDADMARAVLDGDAAIDMLENEIDEASLNILIRTQPVARDLRFIMTAVRMVLDLERIGDEAVTVAEQVLLMEGMNTSALGQDLPLLGRRAEEMLQHALEAFQHGDAEQALKVSRYDEETARVMTRLYQEIMEQVQAGSMTPWTSMHVLFMVRSLDRVCRRAENIAEHAYFMVEGVSLKHSLRTP